MSDDLLKRLDAQRIHSSYADKLCAEAAARIRELEQIFADLECVYCTAPATMAVPYEVDAVRGYCDSHYGALHDDECNGAIKFR